MIQNGTLILASASPRRSELMELAGLSFQVVPADINEQVLPGELPADHVMRLSREKAEAVASNGESRFYVGADTVVVLDGRIMGKPRDEAEASCMLRDLSGREHEVITGITVHDQEQEISLTRSVTTAVRFRELSGDDIRDYVASGCPMDKAGGYAIQGGAVHFVRAISGSYTNVVGLPMAELYDLLIEIRAVG